MAQVNTGAYSSAIKAIERELEQVRILTDKHSRDFAMHSEAAALADIGMTRGRAMIETLSASLEQLREHAGDEAPKALAVRQDRSEQHEAVLHFIKKAGTISVDELVEQSGLDKSQVGASVNLLRRRAAIDNPARGVYRYLGESMDVKAEPDLVDPTPAEAIQQSVAGGVWPVPTTIAQQEQEMSWSPTQPGWQPAVVTSTPDGED